MMLCICVKPASPFCSLLAGPLVAVVINKFSHRSVYMSSGILCMVSMVATAYSPSLFFVYFTFGILVGNKQTH